MKPPALPDLTSQDLRDVNGVVRRLARAANRQDFSERFIHEIPRCLPGEMSGWGETTPDYAQFTGMAVSPAYLAETQRQVDNISRHLEHHPALNAVGWRGARTRPRRISDFASERRFFDTPLYREAYRHLDADHQIAFSPGCFDGVGIVISLNRKRRDYSDRETQKFHLLGLHLAPLLQDLTSRNRIERQLRAIESLWPLHPSGTARLTAGELRHLAALVRASHPDAPPAVASATRNDTRRKALYTVMEKLELESRAQLLALLHELRP